MATYVAQSCGHGYLWLNHVGMATYAAQSCGHATYSSIMWAYACVAQSCGHGYLCSSIMWAWLLMQLNHVGMATWACSSIMWAWLLM